MFGVNMVYDIVFLRICILIPCLGNHTIVAVPNTLFQNNTLCNQNLYMQKQWKHLFFQPCAKIGINIGGNFICYAFYEGLFIIWLMVVNNRRCKHYVIVHDIYEFFSFFLTTFQVWARGVQKASQWNTKKKTTFGT